MFVSRKIRYGLRAIFELAKRQGQGPVKIAETAKAQAIPVRFLEVILNELKQGGFVDSKRGSEGGYMLVRSAAEVTVGDVIRFMQGPIRAVGCLAGGSVDDCPFYGECVFLPMWDKARKAVEDVYDGTSIQDLLEQETIKSGERGADYSI